MRIPLALLCLTASVAAAGPFDGHKLLVTSVRTGDTEVFIADPVTGDMVNVTRSPKSEDRYPCWSPDGKQICFMSDREGTTNLWVANADGSNVRRLNRTPDVCYMPSWQVTPRGERIVFGKHGEKAGMASIRPDGTGEENLGEGHDPTLSPDGKLICYTGHEGGGVTVFVMNHDGTDKRQVVKEISKVGATFPNWSPDSRQIVYSFPVGDALELFIINADGTGQRQLTKFGGTSVCTPSAWSPDGAWISFRKTDERYWSNKERMLKIYSEKPADKRPVWVIRPDGSDAQVIEPLRFQMAIDGSRASWKPMGRAANTSAASTAAKQFTLVDKTIRFLPAAPTNAMPPGTPPVEPPEWKSKYPDPEINHYGDGFRIAFIDPKDSHYIKGRDKWPGIPDNWRAPVNYYDGTIYYRVEVLEKPDEETLTSVIMRVTTEVHEGTHNVWLGHGVCTFREKGVHYFQQPVHAHRPFIRDTKFSFEKPLYEMQLVVADSRGAVVHRVVEQAHNKFQGSPNLGLYLPLKVRYSAVVVAKGEQFEKPAWW